MSDARVNEARADKAVAGKARANKAMDDKARANKFRDNDPRAGNARDKVAKGNVVMANVAMGDNGPRLTRATASEGAQPTRGNDQQGVPINKEVNKGP